MRSLAGFMRCAALALLLALQGCAGAEPRRSRADLVDESVPQEIAIAPMSGIPLGNASRLWTMIADAAMKGGFRVVGDVKAAGYFLELDRRMRGIPRDDPMAVRLRSALHAILAREQGAKGVMYAGFAQRRARVRNGLAMWDGTVERILADDEDPHDSARGYQGEVDAWSLRLWIEDADAALIAEGFGGISIDARLHSGRWESTGSGPRMGQPDTLPAAIRAAVAELERAL